MLKSQPSNDPAYVSFFNQSSKTVDVVWLDFDGNMVRYGVLQPGERQNVNTFSQHPWKSFDSATGIGMLLNGRPVYYPVSVREIHERLQMVQIPLRSLRCQRSPVYISSPFLTLRELCQQMIMQRVKTSADIDRLEIPELLKNYLRQMLAAKENYLHNLVNYVH